ncbi:hypothetical protein SynMITS9220_02184 [Synechococcus sp. MIT S9220]|nr:hypothetical protein SynMITS9220_02184 [Synechococcus sp. MIT S9220]
MQKGSISFNSNTCIPADIHQEIKDPSFQKCLTLVFSLD